METDGDDAGWYAGKYGMAPDPWQLDGLRDWFGVDAYGDIVAAQAGLSVARQNGKNGKVEQSQLYKMGVLNRRILHTAHEVKTARKAFMRLESFFTSPKFPELRSLVKEIRRTNGQEAIVLYSGASCEFVARSRGSGRGFTVDDLYCDEAQELTDEQLSALMPTMSAAPSGIPQLVMTGTPPPLALANGPFARMRNTALAGGSELVSWTEWACDNKDGLDLDDERLWAEYNPGYGIRLNRRTILSERSAMDVETFMRERLGMWDGGGKRPRLITADTWHALEDPESTPTGETVGFGIATTYDNSMTTVAVAAVRSDGNIHVGIAERKPGALWVKDWATERQRRWRPAGWALNPAAPAGSLVSTLAAIRNLNLIPLTGREYAAACGSFYTHVSDGAIRHAGNVDLALSVDGAAKGKLGDAWQWVPADPTVDITPIQAASLAVTALDHKRAKKQRSGKAVSV